MTNYMFLSLQLKSTKQFYFLLLFSEKVLLKADNSVSTAEVKENSS